MSRVFVDTSAWYALAAPDDVSHDLAVRLLGEHQRRLATTDHVLVETWAVARSRRHRAVADELVATILDRNVAEVLTATPRDIVTALRIGETSPTKTSRWSTGPAGPSWSAAASPRRWPSTSTSLCTASARA